MNAEMIQDHQRRPADVKTTVQYRPSVSSGHTRQAAAVTEFSHWIVLLNSTTVYIGLLYNNIKGAFHVRGALKVNECE